MQLNLSLLYFYFLLCIYSCTSPAVPPSLSESKHHLNIPSKGIESMMEANSQKIIEGTDGSVVIALGEVTRKKADVTIKHGDKILDERLLTENETIQFDYEDKTYTLKIIKIKKPLIGEGKAQIAIY